MRIYLILNALILCSLNIGLSQTNAVDKEREWIQANHLKTKEQWDYRYVGEKPARKGFLSSKVTYNAEGRATEIINFQNNGLIGNVSSYSFDPNGNQKEYVKYTGNKDRMLFKQTFAYDDKGNKVKETGFNGTEEFKNIFSYNSQGKLVQIQYYLEEKLDETRLFKYWGDEVEVTVNDGQGGYKFKILNKLDKKGNIIEMDKIEKNDVISEKTLYSYNDEGLVSTEEKSARGSWVERYSYSYDSNGNITEKWMELPGTEKYLKNSYTYRSDGRIAEEKWRSSPTSDFSYKKYIYDSKGQLLSIDSYFASYKYRVLNKFSYK